MKDLRLLVRGGTRACMTLNEPGAAGVAVTAAVAAAALSVDSAAGADVGM